MLDIQQLRREEKERLRALGMSEDEIVAHLDASKRPFKPVFVNGKRRERRSEVPTGTFEVPTGEFAMPQRG